MNRTDFRHLTPVTVHWGDMDALGHVNNVIFFRYVESGRISYFNELAGDDPSIWVGRARFSPTSSAASWTSCATRLRSRSRLERHGSAARA